jgi:hypothetical protein
MATPTVHAVSIATADSGTAPAITIPNSGAGAAAGDLALLVIAVNSGTITTDMAAAGWTAGPTTAASPTASGGRLYTYTRTLASGDLGSTVTLTLSGSSRTAMACLVTSPASVDVSSADPTNTNGTAVAAPSVTATAADGLLVTIHGTMVNTQSVSATWTADAATTERADVSSSSVSAGIRNSSMLVATQALTASGATGTRTATSTQTMQRQGISLVLADATSATHQASVALTAASTLTGSAARVQPATVALTSGSALDDAAILTSPSAAALASDSGLAAAATTETFAATALAADSTLTVDATRTHMAETALAAGSTLAATATSAYAAAIAMTGDSSLTASANVRPAPAARGVVRTPVRSEVRHL